MMKPLLPAVMVDVMWDYRRLSVEQDAPATWTARGANRSFGTLGTMQKEILSAQLPGCARPNFLHAGFGLVSTDGDPRRSIIASNSNRRALCVVRLPFRA